ncbi:hypothetical protein SERLA73DRAFT_149116 [Serpula lacrymans var. lacrymans S7.3]|uniref:Uncharacterized protein n=1 Tax=Serpula lacrymans var. lacrymans (strain S7.3) TaxID=936435 RepID=F8PFE3_SERL3|nr:hypothetical protein SERLA73DRAFT_149116 [Serpula lacrymans var. lacrymans S7.3]
MHKAILVDEDLFSPATFSDLQAILRSFLMTYYQISTGNPKTSVPWTSLVKCLGDYIDLSKGYIPSGYKFQEPSHMTKEETRGLLDHWYNQQNNINAKVTFRFKSSLHPVANKGKDKEKEAMKRALPRARMVVPRSKSTNKEQEELEGLDEIQVMMNTVLTFKTSPGPPNQLQGINNQVRALQTNAQPRPGFFYLGEAICRVGETILPFCKDMTTAIQNSLESVFPDKAGPLPRMVTRVMQSPTKCGHEEMDEEPRNIAHRTRSGNSPVKQLQQAKDTKVDQTLKVKKPRRH